MAEALNLKTSIPEMGTAGESVVSSEVNRINLQSVNFRPLYLH